MNLTQTATLIRAHHNKDGIGAARVAQNEAVSTDVPCEVQALDAIEVEELGRLNRIVTYAVYVTQDIAAQVNDKLSLTSGSFSGKTLDVTGYRDMAGKGRWFRIDAEDRTTGESVL